VVFQGLFGGIIAGVLWVVVREWLPSGPVLRAGVGGVVAALLGSFLVVSPENRDFGLLEPAGLHVAMFAGIVGLTGAGAAVLDGRVRALLPAGGVMTVVAAALVLLGATLGLPLVVQAFVSEEFCGCREPPRVALAFLAVAGVLSVARWSSLLGVQRRLSIDGRALRIVGSGAVVGACIVAGLDLLEEIRAIV
jgi:hypothetical protein